MSKTIIGLFDSRTEAEKVVQELVGSGINRQDVSIVATDSQAQQDLDLSPYRTLGIPDLEARSYAEAVRRGATLLCIRTEEQLVDRATDILERHGAIDIDQRAAQWSAAACTDLKEGEVRLPVVEEELQVGKRQVRRGGVRVVRYVTETPVEEKVQLREEHIKVDRHPVNRPASEVDLASLRDSTLEVTETAEEAVVSKQARVVEEVVIGKEVAERTETVRDTVRRTEVEVEDLGTALAKDKRYSSSDWSVVEPEARRRWEESHQGAWEDFKDSVRSTWEKVRGQPSVRKGKSG